MEAFKMVASLCEEMSKARIWTSCREVACTGWQHSVTVAQNRVELICWDEYLGYSTKRCTFPDKILVVVWI